MIAGFVASAVFAVLFILQERRAPQPMLPLSLFRHRIFALTSLVGLLVNVAFYGLIFVFSLYFQRVNGMSPFAAGLAFVPMMGAILPVNLFAPRLSERVGAPVTIAIGAALSACGCLALLGIAHGTPYWATCLQLIVIGAGLGLLVPPLTSALLGSVEKSRSGIAAGVLNATRQTGSVLGVAMFGGLVGQSDAFVAGAHEALLISAALLLVAGAGIWCAGLGLRKSDWPLVRAHSITLSARSTSPAGSSTPIAFAVLRLTASWKFEGCSTGTSAGLAPRNNLTICRAR